MPLFPLLIIGGGCGWLAHRFMNRCYGPVDDMLWGILGALLGTSLVDLMGLSEYGSVMTWIMTLAGANLVLLLTSFKLES